MPETPRATLDLVDRRIRLLDNRLDNAIDEDRERTRIHLGAVKARSEQLRGSLDYSDPDHTIEVGQALLRVLDNLEADVEFVKAPDMYDRLDQLERQVRRWMGSIDDIAVQAALGRMEARDDLEELRKKAEVAWRRAAHGLAIAGDDARVVVDDVEQVVNDLRHTVRAVMHG